MELLIGIAVGAAFSKFWIMVYEWGKSLVMSSIGKANETKDSQPK